MPYEYSDPSRETEVHALPNVEVFHMGVREFVEANHDTWMAERAIETEPNPHSNLTDCSSLEGFYYAFGFPGCLWDSDPIGPFDTYELALADAREGN